MTYNSGTATDYIDMLDQLIEVVTSRNMATAAINAGGTGHAIGDIIDIDATGSTSTHLAKIEVTSVAAGVIDGIRIYRGGAYTVDPTTIVGNAQSATTGAGINATFDITFAATGWSLLQREEESVSAVVAAGGTGYTNGSTDVLTLIGGVLAPGGAAATYTATVAGGIVTSVAQLTAGDYEVFPSNPVLTSVAPVGGTGCTLTVTKQITSGDTIVTLQGDAGASLDPLVGIKTYSSETDESSANTVYNWALFGMTLWDSGTNLHLQANISDGFSLLNNGDITTNANGDGAFVPLKDSDAFDIEWVISATGRRWILIAKVETASTVYYAQCGGGLLNQFGITTELPFPMFIAGTSDRKRVWYADVNSLWGGISEVISRSNGPNFVWAPEGTWINARNATISSSTSLSPSYSTANTAPRAQVWPLGESNTQQTVDDQLWTAASSLGFDNDDLTLTALATRIYRTPDTGGDLFPLYGVTVTQNDSATDFFRTFGEIDGVWWLDQGDSGLSSEDRLDQGGVKYAVFQNGTRIQPWSYMALRED